MKENWWMIPAGAMALLVGVSYLSTCLTQRRWSKVPGHVLERSAEYNHSQQAHGAPAFRYEPRVKYTYTVEEQIYTGMQVTYPLNWLNSKPVVQKYLDRLPDDVQVHYNPQKPQEACLEMIGLGWPIFAILFGGFILLMGLVLVFAPS